jgi:site-specific DNA recombinase
VKNPATGKRISRPNPKDQYKIVEVPHLRIIDAETWSAAQSIKGKRHHESSPKARAPKRAFSGLIKCGACGAGMASIGRDAKGLRVQCSGHRENGTCENGRRVYLDEIEIIVVRALRQHLEQPAVITEYVTAYNQERKRLRRQSGNDLARLTRRDGEIRRELGRLIDSIAQGMPAGSIAPRVRELESERLGIAAAIERAKESDNVIALHSAAIDRYKRDVADLGNALKGGDEDQNAGVFGRIRDLVSAIVVHAAPNTPGIKIDIKGRLAALCGADLFPNISAPQGFDRQSARGINSSGGLAVAREGLEPPTPGL